jgi:Flp pilus assembly protein TadG
MENSSRPQLKSVLRRLSKERRAASSVEFAVEAMVFFAFLFAIVNLGDLGLVLGTLQHGVDGAVRTAAVQTGAGFSAGGATNVCAGAAQIDTAFNGVASPVLPPAGGGAPNQPVLGYNWTNNTGAGTYVTVTAQYNWSPIGFPASLGAMPITVPLTVTSTQMVVGTSGSVTGCV